MTNPLTIQEAEALKSRALDEAVRDAMGWVWDESRCRVCGWTLDESAEEGCVPNNCCMRPVPERREDEPAPYSSRYDCIIQVENEIEKRGLTEPYIEALSQIVAPECVTGIYAAVVEVYQNNAGINGHEFMWRMAHATPEQRARAVVLMAQEIAAQDRLMHQMSDGDGRRE